jgi:hypothetical protein
VDAAQLFGQKTRKIEYFSPQFSLKGVPCLGPEARAWIHDAYDACTMTGAGIRVSRHLSAAGGHARITRPKGGTVWRNGPSGT